MDYLHLRKCALQVWLENFCHYINLLFFVHFLNYILLIMLLQLPWFSPLGPPPLSTSQSVRQSPHHCSCPWVMCIGSLATPFPVLYFTSPWLFCNYLFVLLNPITSSFILPKPPPIWQPSKCSLYPSMILSLFFLFP